MINSGSKPNSDIYPYCKNCGLEINLKTHNVDPGVDWIIVDQEPGPGQTYWIGPRVQHTSLKICILHLKVKIRRLESRAVPLKAFAVSWKGRGYKPTLIAASTPGKAKYTFLLHIRDADYSVDFKDLEVRPDRKYNKLAGKAERDGTLFTRIKGIELPKEYYSTDDDDDD